MIRKIVLLCLILAFTCVTPVFATDARYGLHKSQPIESNGMVTDRDGNTMDYGVWVYSISIFADAANSSMGVYDAATTAFLDNGTSIHAEDEIGEADAYDSQTKKYDKPVYFSNGVGAICSTGVGFVEYGPAPVD